MKPLHDLVLRAQPGTGLQFRPKAYRPNGIRQFLTDLIAMANASVEGPRYIVVGVEIEDKSRRRLRSVDSDDFSARPSYQAVANEFIEPPIRVKYEALNVEGERVGVFCIDACPDKPYMMRIDHSETLRRGDAWMRVDDAALKMGRRQLQEHFEKKFHDSMSAGRVEVGFPGDIIHKRMELKTFDLSLLPSTVAAAKLRELMRVRKYSQKSQGGATFVERMMHTRLFGSDEPYDARSTDVIVKEMTQLQEKHADDDEHFMFEDNGGRLQIVVLNLGEDEIRGASLTILLPKHEAVYVAEELPKVRSNGKLIERSGKERDNYPSIGQKESAVEVSCTLGDLLPNVPVEIFREPIRICVGSSLQGRRLGIHYKLFAQNLREPILGKLRLIL